MSIFVQIASYRDPELINTIEDLLYNAKDPENLTICICNQYDDINVLNKYRNDSRFIIIDVPYIESKGACWARHLIQQKYNKQDYTLQLDSHHRFVKHWDEELINMFKLVEQQGCSKPLLTSYIPSYNPENDPIERITIPWKMNFDRFIPEGAVFFLPAAIENYKELKAPIPARFYSAHFCFTTGQFCLEVPHDPEYYFHGEEISIAARAFTWGYDLFHPHKVVAWHEYTRKNRTKHWDDDTQWHIKNEACHSKNRKLFKMDGEIQYNNFGKYGFGSIRTIEQYEEYAGICFKTRSVQQYTIDNKIPPNPSYVSKEDYDKSFLRIFKYCINVSYDKVAESDYDFWAVSFHDKNLNTLYRKDADENEISGHFAKSDEHCKIWREFHTSETPTYWTVWPHSKTKGWMERITGSL